MFNRLQNGEHSNSWIKLRNCANIITTTICKEKLLDKLNDFGFYNNIKHGKQKSLNIFNMYFLIRTFLICDKHSLNVNYLNSYIRKNLKSNNCNGSENMQIAQDINLLVPKVIDIIKYLSKMTEIKCILPELAYIFVCIYINCGIKTVKQYVLYFSKNKKQFDKFNDINTYKTTIQKNTDEKKMNNIYNQILNLSSKRTTFI